FLTWFFARVALEPRGQPQEKVEKFGANAPLGRPGQPVEIAPLYVTLAARENSYTSGQVWCSDGGTGTL
ncbi:TPA: SDR family oxidoreductase, partial [Escherichia coli]